LYNLKVLGLTGNSLTKIPKEIGMLTKLRCLYLCDNSLKEIPKEIGMLINLGYLSLDNNPEISIPKYFIRSDLCCKFARTLSNLYYFLVAKKYYARWRAIIISSRGPKNYGEILILQNYYHAKNAAK
jgi:Leucine-rich repeat (LRR) protein